MLALNNNIKFFNKKIYMYIILMKISINKNNYIIKLHQTLILFVISNTTYIGFPRY